MDEMKSLLAGYLCFWQEICPTVYWILKDILVLDDFSPLFCSKTWQKLSKKKIQAFNYRDLTKKKKKTSHERNLFCNGHMWNKQEVVKIQLYSCHSLPFDCWIYLHFYKVTGTNSGLVGYSQLVFVCTQSVSFGNQLKICIAGRKILFKNQNLRLFLHKGDTSKILKQWRHLEAFGFFFCR